MSNWLSMAIWHLVSNGKYPSIVYPNPNKSDSGMFRTCVNWAATWQNQQSQCAPSEDSDQPGHPPNLTRVFAVRMKKAWVLNFPVSAQRTLWSDWALSLRWAHSHFVVFVMSRLNCLIRAVFLHQNASVCVYICWTDRLMTASYSSPRLCTLKHI